MKENDKIFIYGVPGVGKSYLSKELGKKLKLLVIEGDKIKTKLKKNISREQSPFLYLGTCQAYKKFGELNQENAVNGLLAVRKALSGAITEEVKNWHSLILEAAFLDPSILQEIGKVILVITSDEKRHKKQFLHHRERLFDIGGNEFRAARIVQKYLVEEATGLNVQIIDNDGTQQALQMF